MSAKLAMQVNALLERVNQLEAQVHTLDAQVVELREELARYEKPKKPDRRSQNAA